MQQTQTGSPSESGSRSSSPSLSITRSQSVTRTPSSTGTRTGSQERTPTQTGSKTSSQEATPTHTGTSSASQAVTPSQTRSETATLTSTPSVTLTPSITRTETITPSLTQTQTASGSQTPSCTQSQTRSETQTMTPSVTSTATRSQSQSPSGTPSTTGTQTQTASATRTPSGTATGTQSPSQALTGSVTASLTQSATQTGTASQSETRSQTQTASQTQTLTASQSQTPSVTATPSPTQSPSQTQTASVSQTTSQTATPSQTQTQTASQTQTSSVTQTPSSTVRSVGRSGALENMLMRFSPHSPLHPQGSPSPTQSPSQSETQTPSETQSASQSSTASETGTPSVTATPSSTQSPSPTQSPSETQTQTASLTASQSQTPSQTQTQSASVTQTPSQTQSHTPSQTSANFRLTLVEVAIGAALAALEPPPLPDPAAPPATPTPLPLSDSMPAAAYVGWLNRCPDSWLEAGGVALICSAEYDAGAGIAPGGAGAGGIYAVVEVEAGVTLAPDTPSGAPQQFDILPACAAAAARDAAGLGALGQQVLLPARVVISPAFRAATAPGLLSCSAWGVDGTTLITGTALPLAVAGTRWPLAADAMVITGRKDSLDPAARWAITSSQLGPPPNVTAARAQLSACGYVPASAVTPEYGACAVAVAQAIWGAQAVPGRTAAAAATVRPFAFNTTGPTVLVLRSEAPNAFSLGMNATVAGAACTVAFVSADGAWAALSTPPADALCGPTGAGCGFSTLVLATPSDDVLRGASLACPPFCPGALPTLAARAGAAPADGVIPLPLDPAGAAFAPALASTVAAGAPAPLSNVAAAAPPGVHYSPSCADRGYTDPRSGACTNASEPASLQCALGEGTQCADCPANALCPGGSAMWPRAGYFAFTESDGAVQACGAPDPTVRCLGWDPVASAQVCGPGYLAGSYLCGACANRYYPASDGSCAACPVTASGWERYKGLVLVIAAIGALILAVYGFLVVVVVKIGGTIRSSATHAVDLGVWTVTTAQAVAQVASVTTRSLPPLLASFFSAVSGRRQAGAVAGGGGRAATPPLCPPPPLI